MNFAANHEGFKEFIYKLSSQEMYLYYRLFSMQKNVTCDCFILLLYIIS